MYADKEDFAVQFPKINCEEVQKPEKPKSPGWLYLFYYFFFKIHINIKQSKNKWKNIKGSGRPSPRPPKTGNPSTGRPSPYPGKPDEDKNDDDHNEPRVNYEPHNRNLVNISLLLHTVVARKVEFERFKI